MITLNNIVKVYGKDSATVKALNGVSLKISQGEMIAIIGKSGSGKSTLLNILGGLDNVTSGEYFYKDIKINTLNQNDLSKFRRENIGFILQYFALIEDISVFENIALPLQYAKKSKKEIIKRINDVTSELGIQDKLKKYPNEISGGERQRVAIARAIINSPDTILADEPTGALDSATESSIMNIFIELNKKGKTIILVTHDIKIAQSCKRIITLSDGKIVENIL